MKTPLLALTLTSLLASAASTALADNPLIMDQFTADPTGRLFDGKIYLYPSHDMNNAHEARNGAGWFAMEDYHVFSSSNLIDWKDHGVIINQKDVPWVNGAANAMWAPDCVTKNGKYYFYFPASNRIGVAIADHPEGPFKVEAKPITGGIDPCCFLDKDGTAYLVWAQNALFIHKLKPNMTELDPDVQTLRVPNLPTQGLVEGPFMFERKGIYYLTYPHAVKTAGFESEQLEYATGTTPLGPFTVKGVIMDQTANHCWTNHHSLVEYQGQWILFYHDKQLSPSFDKDRSVQADYITFNDDGTINKVVPTFRGVGTRDAKARIQIDRYSAMSKEGATVDFIDKAKTFDGWKTTFTDKNAWIQYNRVDFGAGGLKSVKVRALSSAGGTIEIRLDNPTGPVIAKVNIAKADDWKEMSASVLANPTAMHNLVVSTPDKAEVAIDWVSFE